VQSETVLSGKFAAAPLSIDEVIAAFARVQHGLVTLVQLLEAGLTESAISKRVARGALHRVHRTVYSVGHAALSRDAEMLAAVLAAGPGALLSHLSAAELRKISRFRATVISVLVPRKREVKGVRMHTTRHLHRRDVTSFNRIPVTSMPRLFVDLSDVLTPHQLANVMHEAAFRGLFSDPATRDAIERANGRHNLWVVEKALALNATGSAGTKSGHEDALLVLLESTALPEPRVNTELLGFEPDCHWPDRKLVVEVDGIGHGRQRTRRQDAHEDRVLRAAGYTVLRFTDDDIQLRPERVIRALGAWAGP
jgi:very-short-patch-repair endonuclease